jgi:phosphohistidine phosphatase
MRRLLLLRHGKADRHSAGGDRDRPLTRRGLKDARRMGEFLLAQGFAPDLAVTSDARRAKQTLDLALAAFPGHVTQFVENSIYLATAEHLLDILRQSPDRVGTLLVVGHNPGFADLAVELAGEGDSKELHDMQTKFPPASLAILDFTVSCWAEVGKGAARLYRFVTPDDLRELDGDEDE